MSWKEKYKNLQNILDQTKQDLEPLSDKIDYEYKLDQLEKEYQDKIKGFSPAYLSGSSWYVGPSLKKHIQENDSSPGNMDLGIFSVLCYLSHRKKEDPK